MNSKFLQALVDFFYLILTSVDFGIGGTRHIKFPLITQQESHTTSCNSNLKCLKQGNKNRNFVLNREGKSVIFVLNRVRVGGAGPYLPTQGYIEYPPPPQEKGRKKSKRVCNSKSLQVSL